MTTKQKLPREDQIEAALSWAHQTGYALSRIALDEYCTARELDYVTDAMYQYVTFLETGNKS